MTYDTGTVTASVNGVAVTTPYNAASTTQTVASALAAAIGSAAAGRTATASAQAITVTASQTGTAGDNITATLSSSTSQPQFFSAPSFAGTSATLTGGMAGSSAGPIYTYNIPAGGYAPNGNLLSYSDCVSTTSGSPCVTSTWAANYDSLNRVSGAMSSAGPWDGLSLGWLYDSFGNRTTQAVTASSPPIAAVPQPQTLNFASNDNHIGNYGSNGYDAAGHVINDGISRYAYDAEGRVCAVQGFNGMSSTYTQYVYDAEGRRVGKGSIQPPPMAPFGSVWLRHYLQCFRQRLQLARKLPSRSIRMEHIPGGSTGGSSHLRTLLIRGT